MSSVTAHKLSLLLVLSTCLAAACIGSAFQNGVDPNSDAGIVGDGGITNRPDMAIDIKAEFAMKVQPILVGDCGQCHAPEGSLGPRFLAANPDVFTTFVAFPGLIGVTPESSRILLKEPHVGPATYKATSSYTPSAEMMQHAKVISDWITLFNQLGGKAAQGDMGMKARVEPFLPMGGQTKTVDLGLLDPQFAGATFAFQMTMIGTTQIQLSNITLTASASKGVHIKTPVFARYAAADPNVAIDINYDYLDKDFTAFPGTSVVLSPSLTIFTYNAGELLNFDFGVLEPSGAMTDMGGGVTMCKDLTAWTAFKPLLQNAQAGMNNACAAGGCHGQAGGVGGMNLNGIANAANDSVICVSVLNNTVPANPIQSPIYQHPTDASNHAGGKMENDGMAPDTRADWLAAITTFVNAQK
jgi:hypothetical protein